MEKRSGIDAVRNFWERVWQSPQNYDAVDDLVVEDFVFISGGRRIEGRKAGYPPLARAAGSALAGGSLPVRAAQGISARLSCRE
jgi:hypothetical protein